jgi:predicted porin
MKKSLLAIAAMTAFAGAAQAQSSVTVYGILDVGFVGSHYNGTSASTANANTTGGNGAAGNISTNAASAGFGQSAESTSRIGFKGSEDLGGGLSGIFTLETAVDPDFKASAFAFNRQTFVGLDKKGLGAAMVGTQYTPLFDVQSITDAAGNNNLVGNAVYSGSLQSSTGTYNTGLAAYANRTDAYTSSLDAVSGAYVTRASNALKIQSDRMAGLKGQAFYAQSNQSQTNQAPGQSGANNNTMFGFNADYIWKNLQVVAAYQSARSQNGLAAGTLPGTSAINGFVLSQGSAGSPGNNMSENSTYGAATYDFGILKGYAQYITTKAFSTVDNTFGTSRSAYQLGARSQLTPTISVYATYGLGKSSYAQYGTAYANFRTAQLGSDYYLSKRTNLYVAYGSANQSSNGATGATTGVTGVSSMNYAAGIRHTF